MIIIPSPISCNRGIPQNPGYHQNLKYLGKETWEKGKRSRKKELELSFFLYFVLFIILFLLLLVLVPWVVRARILSNSKPFQDFETCPHSNLLKHTNAHKEILMTGNIIKFKDPSETCKCLLSHPVGINRRKNVSSTYMEHRNSNDSSLLPLTNSNRIWSFLLSFSSFSTVFLRLIENSKNSAKFQTQKKACR